VNIKTVLTVGVSDGETRRTMAANKRTGGSQGSYFIVVGNADSAELWK